MFGCGRFTRNDCFFWLSLVVRKLVVGYVLEKIRIRTLCNAGRWGVAGVASLFFLRIQTNVTRVESRKPQKGQQVSRCARMKNVESIPYVNYMKKKNETIF